MSVRHPNLILRVITKTSETTYLLDSSEYIVGRLGDTDIQIDVGTVSRIHARLIRSGARYRYVHLGTSNPTLFEGSSVDERWLSPGDRLEIAPGSFHSVTLAFEAPPGRHP